MDLVIMRITFFSNISLKKYTYILYRSRPDGILCVFSLFLNVPENYLNDKTEILIFILLMPTTPISRTSLNFFILDEIVSLSVGLTVCLSPLHFFFWHCWKKSPFSYFSFKNWSLPSSFGLVLAMVLQRNEQ
jgi:hypothetical protein